MRETCLNQWELAARWKISPGTLERWRWIGDGLWFLKIGGHVIYRIEDVEAFERAALQSASARLTVARDAASEGPSG